MYRLKELRKSHHMNQLEFAKKIGAAQNTVSNWENGKRQIDTDTAVKIADLFGVSVDYLLGRSDEPNTLSLDEQMDGIEFALYGEVKELTDEQKQEILDYVRFKKQQRK